MRARTKGWFACWMMLLSVAAVAATGSDLPLVDAVKNHDKVAAEALLKQNVDVNASLADGATALAWAVYWDDLETADLLIRANADVNAVNDNGVTPLSLACTNHSAPMVETLLKARANPNTEQWNGETPLMTCAYTGSVDAVKALLDHGANVNARENGRAQTVLMAAVAGKHPDVVLELIKHGADVHARNKSGFTSLMFAAQQGVLESADILLANGANVNDAAPTYGNALTVAAANQHERLALFLLEKGADPNVADRKGITPLHYAVARGIADAVGPVPGVAFDEFFDVRPSNMRELARALLAKGANPNARIKENLVTFGTTVAMARRLPKDAVVDATPYVLAAIAADVDLMRILLAGGADPRLLPKGKKITPLIAAAGGAWNGYRSAEEKEQALEAVKLVVESGADVNETNAVGQTAVHAAAYTGADAIIRYLADKGANVDVKSRGGETPWSMAEGISPVSMDSYAGHKNIAALLLQLGATAMTSAEIEELKSVGTDRSSGEPDKARPIKARAK